MRFFASLRMTVEGLRMTGKELGMTVEGLRMTKSSNDAPIGSLRGLPAVLEEGGAKPTKQSHIKSLMQSKDNYLVLDTDSDFYVRR
jgi:hypothetical protein